MSSRVGAITKLVGVDVIGSLVWFPVWWYTSGLFRIIKGAKNALNLRLREYGFAIWIKNFFNPMYGQYDVTGRIVSVFMRLVVLIGRIIALVVEAVLYVLGVCLWILAPIGIVGMIVVNISKAL
jgi:hypothetical protein